MEKSLLKINGNPVEFSPNNLWNNEISSHVWLCVVQYGRCNTMTFSFQDLGWLNFVAMLLFWENHSSKYDSNYINNLSPNAFELDISR